MKKQAMMMLKTISRVIKQTSKEPLMIDLFDLSGFDCCSCRIYLKHQSVIGIIHILYRPDKSLSMRYSVSARSLAMSGHISKRNNTELLSDNKPLLIHKSAFRPARLNPFPAYNPRYRNPRLPRGTYL